MHIRYIRKVLVTTYQNFTTGKCLTGTVETHFLIVTLSVIYLSMTCHRKLKSIHFFVWSPIKKYVLMTLKNIYHIFKNIFKSFYFISERCVQEFLYPSKRFNHDLSSHFLMRWGVSHFYWPRLLQNQICSKLFFLFC